MGVYYVFSDGKVLDSYHVGLPYGKAKLSSIVESYPAATFYEQEIEERYGVTFAGNDAGPLLTVGGSPHLRKK